MSFRNIKSSRFLILGFLFVVFLVLALFGAKLIYNRLNEPDRYVPTDDIVFTSPAPSGKNTSLVKAKEPGNKAILPGAKWVAQTFNNCGPATTSMVLQYFGLSVGQDQTKAKLRTNPDDKNVFTYEIANYIKSDYNIDSKLLYGGDIYILKKLIANGFYVVVEDWLHPNEDIGHTTIIRGFDDEQGVLIADDSYIGVNITYPYDEFRETQWKAFNYEYLPVYKEGSEDLLKSIVGESWDPEKMYQKTANMARDEISKNENDLYAWFNLGSSLYHLGDYENAKSAFEKSKSIGWPKRMLWYQIEPIQTYNALHEYHKAIEMADIALWGNNDSFAEAHLEKAIAYKGLNDKEKAKQEVEKALYYYPNFKKAQDFLASL